MAGEEIRGRYEQYMTFFGKTIHVTVNRPLNTDAKRESRDKNAPDVYPINGGYVTLRDFLAAGLLGKEQADAVLEKLDVYKGSMRETDMSNIPLHYVYILGVDTPLRRFRGQIIAVVRRENDLLSPTGLPLGRYDRLIVAPEGMEFYEPQIRAAIGFAEKRFRYRLYCMYEKSCGAVVYTVRAGKPLYLLIRNRSGHIGFPKGHVEYGEDEAATMKREIFEETALHVMPDLHFREEYHYVLWGVVHKTAVYSTARFSDGETVTTMENEIYGDWLVPYEEARRLLSYENDKGILDRADSYLKKTGAADIK